MSTNIISLTRPKCGMNGCINWPVSGRFLLEDALQSIKLLVPHARKRRVVIGQKQLWGTHRSVVAFGTGNLIGSHQTGLRLLDLLGTSIDCRFALFSRQDHPDIPITALFRWTIRPGIRVDHIGNQIPIGRVSRCQYNQIQRQLQ